MNLVPAGTSLTPYFLGLGSNLCFAIASLIFARFSKSHSPTWVNQLKVSIAFIGFALAYWLLEPGINQQPLGVALLLTSGFLGLFVGDYFLFKAFAEIGPARTLVVFSFQPLLMAAYGSLFLEQTLNRYQAAAIVCMIFCLFLFLAEKKRTLGHWHLLGFASAFLGVLLDSVGVICTREAYELDAALGPFQTNATRAIGAMIGFALLGPKSYVRLAQDLIQMDRKTRTLAIGGSLVGTFLSLSLYLSALKTAHVASLTAITITLPIWAGLFEHLRDRKWPHFYLWMGFVWFCLGFASMIRGLQ